MNRDQQCQLADKENSGNDGPVGLETSRAKRKKFLSIDSTEHDQIRLAASKFTYMACLWARKLDHTLKLDNDPDYDPAKRFENIDNICQGQLQDLLVVIPNKLHCHMKDKMFYKLVSK